MAIDDRASAFTIENAKVRRYSDFMSSFELNPLTGYLAMLNNEESVRQSLRNLVLTGRTERFYSAHIGSKIWSMLFEPVDEVTNELLVATIKETIENCEPRVTIVNVMIDDYTNYNGYLVNIVFMINTIPDTTFDTNFIVRRVR